MSDTLTEHRIHSYPSIYAVGHKAIEELFLDPVVVEEKVDGSQFSFGLIHGELMCRSKGKQLVVAEPEKMFLKGVETAQRLAALLTPNWVYRGEYLQSPKHNTLAYDRIPKDHIILYDINPGLEEYLSPGEKRAEADRIGLEMVPCFQAGTVASFEELVAFTERESVLGGATMEGIVVKNYHRFTVDKKAMMGKYVRPAFKESHKMEWRASNPTKGDVVERIIAAYKTDARWEKAVQHLRDRGELTESPQDIGPLLREVPADILKECREEIAAKLFEWAWPQIQRGVTGNLPQWYKDRLAKSRSQSNIRDRESGRGRYQLHVGPNAPIPACSSTGESAALRMRRLGVQLPPSGLDNRVAGRDSRLGVAIKRNARISALGGGAIGTDPNRLHPHHTSPLVPDLPPATT